MEDERHSTPGRKRRLAWIGLAVVSMGGLLVALMPTLASQPAFHSWVVQRATGEMRGDVSIDRLRLRWLSPPTIEGFQLVSPDGDSLFKMPLCAGNRSLLSCLVTPEDLGTFRVQSPELTLVILPQGTNFSRTFGKRDASQLDDETDSSAKEIQSPVTAHVQIVNGRFAFRRDPDPDGWFIEGLNVDAGIDSQPPDGGSSWIRVPAGQLLDHVELTPRICDDLLKFITPALADSSEVDGQASISVDHIDFPLGAFSEGDLSGELVIHSVRAAAGPVISGILALFGAPEHMELVKESRVQFLMRDGRVHHEGFQFHTGNIQFQTSGWVGLDESLDLVAQVKLPEAADEADEKRLVSLSGQTLNIPIRGTLSEPRVDLEKFLSQEESALPDFLDDLLGEALGEGGIDLDSIFAGLRERRQRRQNNQAGEAEEPATGPLRGGLRGLIRELLVDPSNDQPSADEESEPSAPGESDQSEGSESQRPLLRRGVGRRLIRELLEGAAAKEDTQEDQ